MDKKAYNILVIGSGGREHAICCALSRSKRKGKLYAFPGNAGIFKLAKATSLNAPTPEEIIPFCQQNAIEMVVIGPEAPLVAGLADELITAGLVVFGPNREAAQLEGSKAFTKKVCVDGHIPTAHFEEVHDQAAALKALDKIGIPCVVKADGLAAGKGVTVAMTRQDAEQAITDAFSGKFGAAGNTLILEEFLEGEEASLFVLTDGHTVLPLPAAQDHKRAFDGDKGPNTGGMGAISPAPVMTDALMKEALTTIIIPTLDVLKSRGIKYKGVLYAGLMICKDGPHLIEYNVRFGDPEAQILLPRFKNDLIDIIEAIHFETLDHIHLDFADTHMMCIVYAAKGYPDEVKTGTLIKNLDEADAIPGVHVYHAGTIKDESGNIRANGGRVLTVIGSGQTLHEAKQKAYQAIDVIDWPEGFYRTDIGHHALGA